MAQHPIFENLRTHKDAEERLREAGAGAGECVLRPSTGGDREMSLCWAFRDGLYKHSKACCVAHAPPSRVLILRLVFV